MPVAILKIVGYSLLLCIIHLVIYLAFMKGYFYLDGQSVIYTSPVGQEIEALREYERQGNFVSREEFDKLYDKMEADMENFTQDSIKVFKEKSPSDLKRITKITIFFSLFIWPFSILFLSGKNNEVLPFLCFPILFSLMGLLPLLNIFAVTCIVFLVVIYKKRKQSNLKT